MVEETQTNRHVIKLLDLENNKIRTDLEDYYIVTKDRLENITAIITEGSNYIKQLSETITKQAEIISKQQNEISRLLKLSL
jgi:uncharacterized protein YeeX (DUF496 family)